VRLEITDEGLVLEGERRAGHQEHQHGILRSERSYGSFRRVIPLPEGLNPENAQATFKNGVLEVTMQAPQPQRRGRPIEIQGDAASNGQVQPPSQPSTPQEHTRTLSTASR